MQSACPVGRYFFRFSIKCTTTAVITTVIAHLMTVSIFWRIPAPALPKSPARVSQTLSKLTQPVTIRNTNIMVHPTVISRKIFSPFFIFLPPIIIFYNYNILCKTSQEVPILHISFDIIHFL